METLQVEQAAAADKLEEVSIMSDLDGRLRNIGNVKHWWMAVAEAVTNSCDSIRDSGPTGVIKRQGSIKIVIERNEDLVAKGGGKGPIENILVIDDGAGLTETNFRSFCTPDSRHKVQRGGKGLGRFMCLQAFTKVHVDSTYEENAEWWNRVALLQREAPRLSARKPTPASPGARTAVHLLGLADNYTNSAGADLPKITGWLAEHFLPMLLDKPAWLTSLTITDGKHTIDLSQHVSSSSLWVEEFSINGQLFKAVCYALNEKADVDRVRLVAGERVVQANTREIEHFVPHLASISDDKAHVILVHSPFFDTKVNDARNGVVFSEDDDEGLFGITAAQFREELGKVFKVRLAERLRQSTEKMRVKVTKVVHAEAPQYRPLLLGYWASREFVQLSHNSRTEEILASLDSFRRKDTERIKKATKRLSKLKNNEAEYLEQAKGLTEGIEAHKKTVLAEYIVLRKLLLDRLEKVIGFSEEGNAPREADVHDLIFPRRTDSQTSSGIDHQLWILDERLESHEYLASDQPLKGGNSDRPDLLIALDSPSVFGSEPASQSAGYERMVLVEFKRGLEPLEKLKLEDLPHWQMMRYALQISEGKANYHGHARRPIRVTKNVRFYMYAICDFGAAFIERLRREENFIPSPTGSGAFAVKNDGCYYIEYISLEKLLEDAKARNTAFFRKLGLDF